ncbi:UDP-N-acetylmuramoyl-L-alanine--D-glutamate ligase [Candidatus Kaiserbacteria bacterium]|nr:UDP-N-acetylmuramoyl-L-alanine--D-glutamate ligase [Candidatus Kaiserbacteria bacterium]
MSYKDYFKGKKVTVMRIGLLGRGIGDAAYMAEAGAQVLVVDDASVEVMQPAVEALKDYPNITFKFGPYQNEDFGNRDFILVGAGASLGLECLRYAIEDGVPLKQSASLFAELAEVPIIGVTGTRGKSTVTQMIYHTLSVVTGEKILLGGNIRGVSNLQLLKEAKEDSLCVMELDSWQLQGWGWAKLSPQIAVFTNFMEDHLNYYQKEGLDKKAAMRAYFADKANIFKYQKESDVLITTPEVFEEAKTLPDVTLGQEVRLADESIIPEDCLLAMPGRHNRLNAALAYEALKAISLTDEEIFSGLASFAGVEGRLQLLKTVNNVRIYNDNNSTTPQATIAALEALDLGNKNIILIAGGADKGIELNELVQSIGDHCRQVILTPGSGTDRLLNIINGIKKPIVAEDLEKAFEEARLVAENGDIILFSPAFASFGQYKNEYERNDEFVELVNKYE